MTDILSKESVLLLGRTAGNKRNFTGRAQGTANISDTQTITARPIPGGRGITANQMDKFTTNDFSITTDSNAVHDAVLRDAFGHRGYFDWYPENAKNGKPKFVGEAVLSPVLSFDTAADAVTWAVGLAADGEPVRTTLNADVAVPATFPTPAFKVTQCDFLFGTATVKADLLSEMTGSLSFTPTLTTFRRRILSSADRVGLTAQNASVGFAISGTFNLGPETAKVLQQRVGNFVIRRKDANFGYAMPVGVTGRPITSGADATAVTLSLTFTQLAPGFPVGSVPITAAGALAVPAGENAYVVGANGITRHDANTNVPANGFAIVGLPMAGE